MVEEHQDEAQRFSGRVLVQPWTMMETLGSREKLRDYGKDTQLRGPQNTVSQVLSSEMELEKGEQAEEMLHSILPMSYRTSRGKQH